MAGSREVADSQGLRKDAGCMDEPKPAEASWASLRESRLGRDLVALGAVLALFWVGILRHVELPGLYMDAINPDYLVARVLDGGLQNPVWTLPTVMGPILGSLYHGVQNFYVGLPIYALLGTGVVSARLVQALFGAAIAMLVYFAAMRATGNRPLSLGVAGGLATDVAFLASFRTQNYIILGGEAWFLASVLLLLRSESMGGRPLRAQFFSGVCFGLAVYGYFVYLFFLPPVLWIAASDTGPGARKRVGAWVVGLAVGLAPYVVGYASMAVALGGVSATYDYVGDLAAGLAPLSSELSTMGGLAYALDMARIAMTNGGNELMILGEPVGGGWPGVKIVIFAIILVTGLTLLFVPSRLIGGRGSRGRLLVLLPFSYLVVAAALGERLWAHHFSVLVPLAYLLGGIVTHEASRLVRGAGRVSDDAPMPSRQRAGVAWSIAAIGAVLIMGNVWQQNAFFDRLVETGGVRKASSALTILAEDALASRPRAFYVFPEWGFFMSFAFLTGNRVPYGLDLTRDVVSSHRNEEGEICVAFWKQEDREKYEATLREGGVVNVTLETYRQRDARPAFYVLRGTFAG